MCRAKGRSAKKTREKDVRNAASEHAKSRPSRRKAFGVRPSFSPAVCPGRRGTVQKKAARQESRTADRPRFGKVPAGARKTCLKEAPEGKAPGRRLIAPPRRLAKEPCNGFPEACASPGTPTWRPRGRRNFLPPTRAEPVSGGKTDGAEAFRPGELPPPAWSQAALPR